MKKCSICQRVGDDAHFELHHLHPGKQRRTKSGNKETIEVCHHCGDSIHQKFTNQELRSTYNTQEALIDSMTEFVEWIQKQPLEKTITMATKKRRK